MEMLFRPGQSRFSNDTLSPSIWKSTRRNVQFDAFVDCSGLVYRLGHFEHVVAAEPEANVPALHALHVEDPFKEAKVPGRQSSHAVAAESKALVPALHTLHVEDPFEKAKVPGKHSLHELIPSCLEYVPAKHWIHVDGSTAPILVEYVPAEHAET